MKKQFLLFVLCMSLGKLSAQDLKFDVHTTYLRSIDKESLIVAKEISDICPGYATRWIKDIQSIELTSTTNGKLSKANGLSTVFTEEQKNLISNAEIGTELVIDVNYNYLNPATEIPSLNTMHYTVSVIPEVEAEYVGGYADLYEYLREKAIKKIKTQDLQAARIRFEINESGMVSNVKVFSTSGDQKVDKILVNALQKMPNWKAAIGKNGKKVKQEFELSLGALGLEGC